MYYYLNLKKNLLNFTMSIYILFLFYEIYHIFIHPRFILSYK